MDGRVEPFPTEESTLDPRTRLGREPRFFGGRGVYFRLPPKF